MTMKRKSSSSSGGDGRTELSSDAHQVAQRRPVPGGRAARALRVGAAWVQRSPPPAVIFVLLSTQGDV